jgi:hypothetical protein
MSGQTSEGQKPDITKLESALEHAKAFLQALEVVIEGLELNFADGAVLEAYNDVKTEIYDRGMHAYVLLEIADHLLRNMPNHVAEYLENIKELVEDAVKDLEAQIHTMQGEGGGE